MEYTEEQYNSICQAYERACRNATPRAWELMSESEKLSDLQAIENYNAMQQDRMAADVTIQDLNGAVGQAVGNSIQIDRSALTGPDADILDNVDTIFHEGSHVRDFQATILPSVASQFPEGEQAARQTEVPDEKIDSTGYQNHPAEVAARAAGERGTSIFQHDQQLIAAADKAHQTENAENGIVNQILDVKDYNALDYAGEHGITCNSEDDNETNNHSVNQILQTELPSSAVEEESVAPMSPDSTHDPVAFVDESVGNTEGIDSESGSSMESDDFMDSSAFDADENTEEDCSVDDDDSGNSSNGIEDSNDVDDDAGVDDDGGIE